MTDLRRLLWSRYSGFYVGLWLGFILLFVAILLPVLQMLAIVTAVLLPWFEAADVPVHLFETARRVNWPALALASFVGGVFSLFRPLAGGLRD